MESDGMLVQASSLGVTAKVADFGLSRDMLCASKIETRTCGTITHMPPELISSDVMSKVGPRPCLIVVAPPCAGQIPNTGRACCAPAPLQLLGEILIGSHVIIL